MTRRPLDPEQRGLREKAYIQEKKVALTVKCDMINLSQTSDHRPGFLHQRNGPNDCRLHRGILREKTLCCNHDLLTVGWLRHTDTNTNTITAFMLRHHSPLLICYDGFIKITKYDNYQSQ